MKLHRLCVLVLFSVTLSAQAVDLQAGYSFTPADHVTSTKLNNLMGLGTINTDFVHLKTAVLPLAADELLLWQSSGAIYRKARFDTAFLSNTNLIIGQTDDTQPTSADYVLTWDASANSLKRSNLDSLIFTNSALINSRSNWAGPANIANGMTLLGSMGGNLYYQFGVSNLLTFTNLATCNVFHANHEIQIWDFNFGTNRQTTLAGLVTNAASNASMAGGDRLWGYRASTGNPGQVTPTNIAHFVAQQFTVSNIPVPTAAISYTNAHGLSGLPQYLNVHLVCTNAELGYAVGSEVDISAAVDINAFRVGTVSADTVNLYWSSEIAGGTWSITTHATSPGRSAITKANWNLKFQAIFFP